MNTWFCVRTTVTANGIEEAGIVDTLVDVTRPKDRVEKSENEDVYYEWFVSEESAKHYINTL